MTDIYTTHAAIYDAAFDWDVEGEVGSISGLSGLSEGRVLEPMCGSGRLLRGFAAEGFETVGVDASAEMLDLARAHYQRHGFQGTWIQADVTDFDLDEACQLAVCPINSLAHLPDPAAMMSHLNAMSRNLYSGASYWIQLDLKIPGDVGASEEWEFEYDGQTLLSQWACTGCHEGSETHVSRFVFPDGHAIEDEYEMKVWTYGDWIQLIAASPFELSAAYEGGTFKPLAIGEQLAGERIFWQQLVKQH
ncbi:MAG: class I SAM-dependent methyltransferase [Gammaproteobacteria bacterium]|nr:MAG: class I SAM-dependent methyltransferase [Gammaproteobacteria bacterium]